MVTIIEAYEAELRVVALSQEGMVASYYKSPHLVRKQASAEPSHVPFLPSFLRTK